MKRFSFEGNGFEYFKIWIVNIFLIIITLGIYYPWAKVRSNVYLYGNTSLLAKRFNYLASGKQLFLGYLIGVCILVIYLIADVFVPQYKFILTILLFMAIPWVVWRSMKFNMKVTSFNNIKFSFDGGLLSVYLIYFIYPLAFLLLAGIIVGIMIAIKATWAVILGIILLIVLSIFSASFLAAKQNTYLFSSLEYGKSIFKISLETKVFIKILFKTFFVGILCLLGLVLIIFLINYTSLAVIIDQVSNITANLEDKEYVVNHLKFFIPMLILFYILAVIANFIVYAYYKTRVREYIYANLVLDNNITFISTIKFMTFAYIILSNLLLIVITLGLAIPWAKVRVAKYMLENTLISSNIDLDAYLNEKSKNESAIGEEIGDVLDIDTGFAI